MFALAAAAALLVGLIIGGRGAQASTALVLDFEGLGNLERILNFYDGGFGGFGSGPGPDYGISFGPDALALIDADAGGSGNFANEPSANTIAFFLTGPGVVMNVKNGFTDGFSFYYTSARVGTVTVYDGPNGTGNVLATVPVEKQYNTCGAPDPTGAFSCWTAVGVTFSGTAFSVNFGGAWNQTGFDDITLGSATPGAEVLGAQEIEIDIKPGSDRNSINPNSKGVIPVAILGSATFDVTSVDVTALTFGPNGATPAHDLADPAVYADHLQDVNSDGFMDLVSHYRTQDTGIAKGDTEACLTGATTGGVVIFGCDAIKTVGK
ncbi:MAG: hypothetical protein IIC87_01440 [Chloroflexi bacterium]|nr:hypothetical protein [Chloroflexota bacterium]